MGTGRREVAYRKGDSLEAFNAELAVASMRGQGLAERRLSAEWNGTDQWGWISDLGSDAIEGVGAVFRTNRNRFLRHAKGVIHVGANVGQERNLYARHKLKVCWIEPIPEVFATLERNIREYDDQFAVNALVADRANVEFRFNVASNFGGSSSIFEFNLHKDMWPHVTVERTTELRSETLVTLLSKHELDPSDYDCLVIDTQGAELLVLKGAETILNGFEYIKAEAADFDSYAGCCQVDDLLEFLGPHGFREARRDRFANHPAGGAYYDILFRKRPARSRPKDVVNRILKRAQEKVPPIR